MYNVVWAADPLIKNIDANFSKIQHVMANRILPAVKKYAVGTQPVREAARVRICYIFLSLLKGAASMRLPCACGGV